MTSLARLTLGRLLPPSTSGGVVIPSLIDVSVDVPVAATVANPPLTAQVQSPLAISIAGSILTTNVQSPLIVDVQTIKVEVDIC